MPSRFPLRRRSKLSRPQSVTLQRVNGTDLRVVRKATYTYYDSGEPHGNPGDLKTATVRDDADNPLDTRYYRYYKSGEPNGYEHALKYVVEPQTYARLASTADPLTADDALIGRFADFYFECGSDRRVKREKVQRFGCGCGGGIGEFTFQYDPVVTRTDDLNQWNYDTVETLPDGSQNIVYAGEVMLKVFRNSAVQEWREFFQYDDAGRLILYAPPSAVTGYQHDQADLLQNQGGNYLYLSDSAGPVERFDYYASPDAAAGYFREGSLRRGELGAPVPQYIVTYQTHVGADATVQVPGSETVYRGAAGA